MNFNEELEVKLNITEQKYQREVFIHEISNYEIEDFLLQCEIFKNKCMFSFKSDRQGMAAIKQEDSGFKNTNKSTIANVFSQMKENSSNLNKNFRKILF